MSHTHTHTLTHPPNAHTYSHLIHILRTSPLHLTMPFQYPTGKSSNSGSDELYDHEFQCADDSAWYTVRVILNDDLLTVKYQNFPPEKYSAGDFATVEAVDEFCRRLRPLSEQLQDSECYRIMEGMRVCACLRSNDGGDVRFYDAIVDAVSSISLFLFNYCLCFIFI